MLGERWQCQPGTTVALCAARLCHLGGMVRIEGFTPAVITWPGQIEHLHVKLLVKCSLPLRRTITHCVILSCLASPRLQCLLIFKCIGRPSVFPHSFLPACLLPACLPSCLPEYLPKLCRPLHLPLSPPLSPRPVLPQAIFSPSSIAVFFGLVLLLEGRMAELPGKLKKVKGEGGVGG